MGCLCQTFGHITETNDALLNKFFIYNAFDLFFGRQIVFLNFKSLLKRPSLQFNQVTIIPVENSNF